MFFLETQLARGTGRAFPHCLNEIMSAPVSPVASASKAPSSAKAELAHAHDSTDTAHKLGVLAVVVTPFVGLIVAIYLAWGRGIDPLSLSLFAAFSVITILGVTVGFHRLFTHKSFKTHDSIKLLLGIAGSASWEGDALEWVTEHRHHHKHSDTEHDNHSPKFGFLRSHIGWLFRKSDRSQLTRYGKDLLDDRLFMFISRTFLLWAMLGLIAPGVIGWLATGTMYGAFLGFLWGGLVRVLFVHHVTWSVNSICHTFGSRHFRSDDDSRNNVLVGILALGEGWHNNHHAFQTSARHGLFWWQIDVSYILIKSLSVLGLTWDIKVPKVEDMKARMIDTSRNLTFQVVPKSVAEEAAYAAHVASTAHAHDFSSLKKVVPAAAAIAVATATAAQATLPKKADAPAIQRDLTELAHNLTGKDATPPRVI